MGTTHGRIEQQLAMFAGRHALLVVRDHSRTGVPQASVYSRGRRTYRYAFATWWGEGPFDLWIGLNPGTGDTENRRRPTLERCIKRSRNEGAGGLLIANLFAGRSKGTRELRAMPAPVGPHNEEALKMLSRIAGRTIVAWGGNSTFVSSAAQNVFSLLNAPLCLDVTASGQPRHPLYVRGDAPLASWRAPVAPGAAPERRSR